MPGINVTGSGGAKGPSGGGVNGLLGPSATAASGKEGRVPFDGSGPRESLRVWKQVQKANAKLADQQGAVQSSSLKKWRDIGRMNQNLEGLIQSTQSSSLNRWQKINKANVKLNNFLDTKAKKDFNSIYQQANQENRNRDLVKKFNERKYRDTYNEAKEENANHSLRRRYAQKKERDIRKEAEDENRNHNLRKKQANLTSKDYYAQQAFGRKVQSDAQKAGKEGMFSRWRMNKRLDRMEKSTQAELNRKGITAERRSHLNNRMGQIRQARAMNEGGGEGMEAAEGLGSKIMPVLSAVAAAIEIVAKAPFTLNNIAQGLIGLSRPYMDYYQGSAALGRQGGWDGKKFGDMAFEGLKTRTGIPISGEEALGLVNSYGIGTESAEQAARVAGDIKDASRMDFMPNVDPRVLGRYANSMTNMGATFATPGTRASVNGQDDGPVGIMRATPNSLHPFFRDLQRSLIPAFAAGIDASQAMASVGAIARAAAVNGGAGVSASAAGDFYWKYASSGAAGARTGDAQLSAMQGMAQAATGSGFGGAPVQNYMLNAALQQSGGLKAMTSAEGLRKFFGMSKEQYAQATSTPAGQRQMDYLMNAARAGQTAAFMTEAGTVSSGSFGDTIRNHWYDVTPGFAHSGPLEAIERGAAVGQGMNNVITSGGGGGRRPLSTEEHDKRARAMFAYYTKTGLSPAAAAGMVARADIENGLRGSGYGDHGAAYGQFQWHGDRRRAIEAHFGKRVEDMTWQEQTAASRWEMSSQGPEAAAGSAVTAAQNPYDAGYAVSKRLIRPGLTPEAQEREAQRTGRLTEQYAQQFAPGGRLADGYDPNANLIGFDTMKARGGQLNLQAGKAGYDAAEVILTGPLGKGIVELSDATVKIAGYVEDFGKAVLKMTFGVTAIPGRSVVPPAGSHY